jgi:lipoate-protein ligase A
MRLYSLGELDWKDTQLYYHAMAHLGMDGVIICIPRTPYFCVGYHQDVRQELDIGYLDQMGIPYFRRETGGGTVYLDQNQIFYQVVMRRDDPEVPARNESFSERYLTPAMKALQGLGVAGALRPPNDILVNDRKVSGNGGGDIGDCKVVVGNLLVQFDFETMVQGLKVPHEDFRIHLKHLMEGNIETVRTMLIDADRDSVHEALVKAYGTICDDGTVTDIPDEVKAKARELEVKMLSREWAFFKGPARPGRKVKVREGLELVAVPIKDPDTGTKVGWLQVEATETGPVNVRKLSLRESKDEDIDVPRSPGFDHLAMFERQMMDQGSELRKDLLKMLRTTSISKERVSSIIGTMVKESTR